MNRRTARAIHAATNITYWLENPQWNPDVPALGLVCGVFRALPFSVHGAQRRAFYNPDTLLAVSGESVVAVNGSSKVDKFMFRYPNKMPLETFRDQVAQEVGAVTTCLAGIALPTQVSIKQARIFRRPETSVLTVTQTQDRLDLATHSVMDLQAAQETAPEQRDQTARDLETLVSGTERLAADFGYYPDVNHNSGNVRRSIFDGSVTLIDVMPIYGDGKRLIGDKPPGILDHARESIKQYQAFIGQFGA
jgi:hypothetical protein